MEKLSKDHQEEIQPLDEELRLILSKVAKSLEKNYLLRPLNQAEQFGLRRIVEKIMTQYKNEEESNDFTVFDPSSEIKARFLEYFYDIDPSSYDKIYHEKITEDEIRKISSALKNSKEKSEML